MSLTGALNAARNGLSTTQTLSRIAAENVSNATTPGYARRNAVLVSGGAGEGGALVGEVRREINASLIRMSRNETAKMARQQVIHEGLSSYTAFLGQPGDGTSLAEKFSEFSTSLTTLANMPSSNGAQSAAVLAAEDLAASVRAASDHLGNTRAEVDMELRYQVSDLNQALYELANLNRQRQSFSGGTLEAAEFDDRMDSVVDQIAETLDIRTAQTSDGRISIYTTGGVALVEGDLVHDLTFNPGDGTLMAGEQDITPNKPGVYGIENGSLAGLLELKREIIPRFQKQLDEYARSLVQTFEGADASLAPGQAGLFTDNGYAYDAARLDGLAGRLRVNESLQVDTAEVWRIRDGLGSTAPGDAANPKQIIAFLDALKAPAGVSSDTGVSAGVTVADLAAEVVTHQSAERARAESRFHAASSAAEVVNSARENSAGVNIDEEMQRLLLIEQSYAANSRILTTVANMIDTLIAAV
ncbi:flagellar hook-associated protein FlgK [Roseovarius indicus]|uniref:Flagellar hook-associated protein 1 n=1 Tax=Roseovarius indicus TaxID=540747 RepID=A0A0T5PC32_9RHOB|nr:flagellar hook-associated protein FlgK [Roseovarius indicus]KRS18580.1 flagellar hook protein [Roseovarius indicus]QEW25596.1 Flagellar hook-associated protein 1 [Roseovarius indicus]SFE02277.1 flagellar hook-associated protein 1 FlgK [Roseovarius indicus]